MVVVDVGQQQDIGVHLRDHRDGRRDPGIVTGQDIAQQQAGAVAAQIGREGGDAQIIGESCRGQAQGRDQTVA